MSYDTRVCMSHVTRVCMSHVTRMSTLMHESPRTYARVTCHMRMSHVTRVCMSHVTHPSHSSVAARIDMQRMCA